jgi:peptidoglycan/LPS O-acetylase OafA/YrhL
METSLTATQTPTIDTPRRKYLSLQAGRAIAALLVVLHHVSSFIGTEPHLWIHPRIGRWLAGPSLGIAFFFVLSGTVILTAHWNDIGNPASLRSYLRNGSSEFIPSTGSSSSSSCGDSCAFPARNIHFITIPG